MGSEVLSLRLDGELLDRIRQHAARRGMTVQDYVVRLLVRDDFDERFQASVDETAKLGTWGLPEATPAGADARLPLPAAPPGW